MLTWLRQLIKLRYDYQDRTTNQRARMAIVVSVVMLPLAFVFYSVVIIPSMLSSGDVTAHVYIIPIFMALLLASGALIQRGRLQVGASLLALAPITASALSGARFGFNIAVFAGVVLAIIIAGLILKHTYAVIITIIAITTVLSVVSAERLGFISPPPYNHLADIMQSAFVGTLGLIVITTVILAFTGKLEHIARQARRSEGYIAAAAEVGRWAMTVPDLEQMLAQAVELICARFDIDFAAVFLLSPDGAQAVFKAGVGSAGQDLKARRYSLTVGSRSAVGRALANREPVRLSGDDPARLSSPLLAEMQVELALPLTVGERLIGALDLQSRRERDFGPEDSHAFQLLAAQLAAASNNLYLLAESQTRAQERARLLEQTQQALAEVERLNEELIGQSWSEFLLERGAEELGFDLTPGGVRAASEWTPNMTRAAASGRPTVEQRDGRSVLCVPLLLRGAVIGVMEFETIADEWNPASLELAQAVSERLAQTLDSSRLFEQTQRLARRETILRQISDQMQGAASMEELLRIAAEELNKALGASRTYVRLSAEAGLTGDAPR